MALFMGFCTLAPDRPLHRVVTEEIPINANSLSVLEELLLSLIACLSYISPSCLPVAPFLLSVSLFSVVCVWGLCMVRRCLVGFVGSLCDRCGRQKPLAGALVLIAHANAL